MGTLRIDGDIFLYRCAFAAEKTLYLNQLINPGSGHVEYKDFDTKKEATDYASRVGGVNHLWSRKDLKSESEVNDIVAAALAGVWDRYPNHASVLYLTGSDNFREKVAFSKPYKGNRADVPKPYYYKYVRDLLIKEYGALVINGIEADDQIGIDYTEQDIIVSTDKDLDQIPGVHYDWTIKEEYTVTPKQAKTRFFIQLLAGDPVDNIPGIPGIGEAKAAKALANCKSPKEMMGVCVDMYKQAFPDTYKSVLPEQAELVYIRRNPLGWASTKEAEWFVELTKEL